MSDFKFGRKPPVNKPALLLSNILTGTTVPPHPVSEDMLAKLSNWQMLGNDAYGDCVAVTWANERRVYSTLLTDKPYYPTYDQVIKFYKTQNPDFPNQDEGMNIQDALSYLVKNGGPDGVKPLAFAKVNYSNLDEVKAALSIFGCVWIGINVQEANMTQFDNGQPWDYVPGSAIDGGHSVVGGGYLGNSENDVRFITWAQETGFTDNFWNNLVDEAWVVVWPELLGTKQFQEGISLTQLASDYKALTGRDFPNIPTPTPNPIPTPTPVPTPTPTPVDSALAELFTETLSWTQARHSGENRKAAKALTKYFQAKGLI